MPRTEPLATRAPDSSSWPLIGTVFVAVGLLLVTTAAMTGDPAAWPSSTALAGGVFVLAGGVLGLFGLVAGLTEADRPRRPDRGHRLPSVRPRAGGLGRADG